MFPIYCPTMSIYLMYSRWEKGSKSKFNHKNLWDRINIFVESLKVIDLLLYFFSFFSSFDTINYYCQVGKELLLFFSASWNALKVKKFGDECCTAFRFSTWFDLFFICGPTVPFQSVTMKQTILTSHFHFNSHLTRAKIALMVDFY